jgi:hypothetical protein
MASHCNTKSLGLLPMNLAVMAALDAAGPPRPSTPKTLG